MKIERIVIQMSTNELNYTWGSYTFHAPSEQEVFYVTDWFSGELGKGKQYNPNIANLQQG